MVNVQKRINCIVTISALQNGFIDHLCIITTSNCNTNANFHSLQHALNIFSLTSRSLVKASNSGDSSTEPTKSSLHKFPCISPYSWFPVFLLITFRQVRTEKKSRSLLYSSCFRGNLFVCDGATQQWLRIFAY
jgi:hypothetical protein